MPQIHIRTLIDLLKDSIGIEAAEKVSYKAIRELDLPARTFYTEEEFGKICEVLKKSGGIIGIVARIASTSTHSYTLYYEKALAKEKKEKEDLTRLTEALEQKVRQRTMDLEFVQAQMIQSAKMAAIGQLGAGVAHELNNPLGGILGYAQFILEKLRRPGFSADDFKVCQGYIETIEREASRCKKIVANLLKFSRKPILSQPESVDINKALEEVLSFVGHQLILKNIKVFTDFNPDLPKVEGITSEFQQVFTNIILNAQQSMPEGGELKMITNISDDKAQSLSQVAIEFTDSGCGIPEENLSKIFEPFFTTREKEKGTGLGLSVSYQIIQKYRGNIRVFSEVGKGTTFIITLPAA